MKSPETFKEAHKLTENGKIKVTEIRTYVPVSHDYVDLLANVTASIELCSATEELWEIWLKELNNEKSKQLLQRMITITARYLNHPEGRAFSIYQHREKHEFYEISQKIRALRLIVESLNVDQSKPSELEKIESELNQMAKNFRLEIQLLAKSETIEYRK